MKLLLWIVPLMILASGLWRSSYAVSPKQAKLDSLLYDAYNKYDTTAIKKLLKAGANIYKEYDWGSLVVQAYFDDSSKFKFLTSIGVKITRRTPHGWSILHFLAMDEDLFGGDRARLTPEQFTSLLKSKNDVNAVSGNGQTPLHSAASSGMFEFARQLIEHGANINTRDTFGATPLHSVSRNRYKRIPKDWMTCGTGWEYEERLRVKTLPSRIAIVAYLIEHGADVNAIDNRQNLPLHWYRDGCDEFVKLALPRGMRLDVVNDEHETVLHVCAESSEDGSAVAALIAAGMDVNARGRSGMTPLHYTLRRNRIEAVRKLIAAGADLTIRDDFGRTAYNEATQTWHRTEIAKMIRAASGEPEFESAPDFESEVEPPPPLKTEAAAKPKTEIDAVMEEVEKLRKK